MDILLFALIIVAAGLYFISAAQSLRALEVGLTANVFVIDRLIYKVTKTLLGFFIVRFFLFGIVSVPTQLIYNALAKTDEQQALMFASLYLIAVSVVLLLLVLRNHKRHL